MRRHALLLCQRLVDGPALAIEWGALLADMPEHDDGAPPLTSLNAAVAGAQSNMTFCMGSGRADDEAGGTVVVDVRPRLLAAFEAPLPVGGGHGASAPAHDVLLVAVLDALAARATEASGTAAQVLLAHWRTRWRAQDQPERPRALYDALTRRPRAAIARALAPDAPSLIVTRPMTRHAPSGKAVARAHFWQQT